MNTKTEYQQEWMSLHRSYEQYEAYGLMIKIVSIILFFISLWLQIGALLIVIVWLVLWLQEAIWKTFQGRTEQRLLVIESELTKQSQTEPFQFYSQWEAKRPSALGLIVEYVKQALRPTVAFPYIVLIAVSLLSSANF